MSKILFSYEHGDLQAFSDVKSLVSKLEKVDVENGEYAIWDENLIQYKFDVQLWPRFWQEVPADILAPIEGELSRDRIKSIMADYCRKHNLARGIEGDPEISNEILAFQNGRLRS